MYNLLISKKLIKLNGTVYPISKGSPRGIRTRDYYVNSRGLTTNDRDDMIGILQYYVKDLNSPERARFIPKKS